MRQAKVEDKAILPNQLIGQPNRRRFTCCVNHDIGEFAIQDVIQRTCQLVEGQCNAQGIHLELDTEEAPVPVLGDAAHIQQLLLNLVLNAIDAMPEGRTLSICVRQLADQLRVVVDRLVVREQRNAQSYRAQILKDITNNSRADFKAVATGNMHSHDCAHSGGDFDLDVFIVR